MRGKTSRPVQVQHGMRGGKTHKPVQVQYVHEDAAVADVVQRERGAGSCGDGGRRNDKLPESSEQGEVSQSVMRACARGGGW